MTFSSKHLERNYKNEQDVQITKKTLTFFSPLFHHTLPLEKATALTHRGAKVSSPAPSVSTQAAAPLLRTSSEAALRWVLGLSPGGQGVIEFFFFLGGGLGRKGKKKGENFLEKTVRKEFHR